MEDIHLLSEMLAGLFSIEDDFEINSAKQTKALEMIISGRTGGAILVAESDSIIAGMVSLQKVVSTASGGYSILLEDLYVLPEFRDRGIGKCLTDYAVHWGRENDAVRIQLAADVRNRRASDFYKAGGFCESNMFCFYKYI
jgi:ribosomal protein S18 acetylase RimI-like enzyme